MLDTTEGKWKETPRGQAARPIFDMLRKIFPDIQCERTFPRWLFLPTEADAYPIENTIRSALIKNCKETRDSYTSGKRHCDCDGKLRGPFKGVARRVELDFFIPSLNVAIEFDERQHFTVERSVSLRCYGNDVQAFYDIQRWIDLCDQIRAKDSSPPCRDWQRAFRDAVRDIRAAKNGIRLIRLYYRDTYTPDALRDLMQQYS